MKKIASLFARNYDGDRLVRDEVVPGSEWVLRGEGVATEKVDGTCCLVEGVTLFKRYDVKKGRSVPLNFRAAQEADEVTGHQPGWVPVGDGPEDRWHREAFWWHENEYRVTPYLDGTYELIGPKVQGNPYKLESHRLIAHGSVFQPVDLESAERTFVGLKVFFMQVPYIEGIVWHHADGRMVKLKRRDYGMEWPSR